MGPTKSHTSSIPSSAFYAFPAVRSLLRSLIKPNYMKTILTLICASISLVSVRCAEGPPVVTIEALKLVGDLSGGRAAFTLSGVAHVENSKGGMFEILSGRIGLTEVNSNPKWRLRAED